MRISDWSSDVCSSDLDHHIAQARARRDGDRHLVRDLLILLLHHLLIGLETGLGLGLAGARALAHPFPFLLEALPPRSEGARVGKAWFSTCRSRWSPDH